MSSTSAEPVSEPSAVREKLVAQLLSSIPREEHDRLFPVLREGPRYGERILGRRLDRSLLWRIQRKGAHGVTLQTVLVGSVAHTTPRWLIEHFVRAGQARARSTARRSPARRRKERVPA